MGILSKSVTKTKHVCSPLFGDYFTKMNYGKKGLKTESDIRMNRAMIENNSKGLSNTDNMSNLISTMNTMHEKGTVKRTSFGNLGSGSIVKTDKSRMEARLGSRVISYAIGVGSELFMEYLISLQNSSYDFNSKTFYDSLHTYKLIDPFNAKILNSFSSTTFKGKVGDIIDISSLGIIYDIPSYENSKIYSDLKSYILNYINSRASSQYQYSYQDEIYYGKFDATSLQRSSITLTYKGESGSKSVYEVKATYTWKDLIYSNYGSLSSVLNTYENSKAVSTTVYLDKWYNKINKIWNNPTACFIEIYNDSLNIRNVVLWSNYKDFDSTSSTDMTFATALPIKGYDIPAKEKKLIEKALRDAGYKTLDKRIKKQGEEKDAYTQVQENSAITKFDIAQYLDLQPFFKKEARNNVRWQLYLKAIMQYFESIATPGNTFQTAPKTEIRIKSNFLREGTSLRIRLVKKYGIGKFNKACFISTEPYSYAMCLYLNSAIRSEDGSYKGYIQYILDLSYFYSSIIKTRYNSDYDRVNFNSEYFGKVMENSNSEWFDGNAMPIAPPLMDREFNWINDGVTLPKYNEYLGENILNGDIHYDRGGNPDGPMAKFYNYDKNVYYDDRNDSIPNLLSDNLTSTPVILMPFKLWRKVPFVAKKEVYSSTIHYCATIQWEEKTSTWLGNVLGAIIVIVGAIVSIYSVNLGTAIMVSGYSMILSPFISNPFIKLLVQVITTAVTAAYTGGASLGYSFETMSITSAPMLATSSISNITAIFTAISDSEFKKAISDLSSQTKSIEDSNEEISKKISEFYTFGMRNSSEWDFIESMDSIYYILSGEMLYDIYDRAFEVDNDMYNIADK
ncbi:hypothetical protein BWK67_00295 [Campylobacter fetus]|nr:hypothetical protein BWK67_00295 [Campylobacter fetus]